MTLEELVRKDEKTLSEETYTILNEWLHAAICKTPGPLDHLLGIGFSYAITQILEFGMPDDVPTCVLDELAVVKEHQQWKLGG